MARRSKKLPELKEGEKVFLLCGRIDHNGLSQRPEFDQPALDPRSFSWISAEVLAPLEDEIYELVFTDMSTTGYERRFLFTRAEAICFVDIEMRKLKLV